ncbi:Nuclear pore complex protein NUP98A [Camellia lanceoleosa]|uniref:Nuclear pore complex protein NUP98A n=1 Tax=Camellia lanceoleosa TaxID=1840588 RepID=A0ACC0HAM0_9ERIC|nr:Nuclear pore complex protein NUP98A [Camellia lanceoleosa]
MIWSFQGTIDAFRFVLTTGFGFGTTPTFGQSTSASGSGSFFGTALSSFGDQNSFLGAQSTTPTFGTTGFGQELCPLWSCLGLLLVTGYPHQSQLMSAPQLIIQRGLMEVPLMEVAVIYKTMEGGRKRFRILLEIFQCKYWRNSLV